MTTLEKIHSRLDRLTRREIKLAAELIGRARVIPVKDPEYRRVLEQANLHLSVCDVLDRMAAQIRGQLPKKKKSAKPVVLEAITASVH